MPARRPSSPSRTMLPGRGRSTAAAGERRRVQCFRRRAWPALLVTLGLLGSASANEPVRSLLELRRDDVVIQEWDLSCGAAALATLLRQQYDDPVTERTIATSLISRREYIENPQLVQLREGFSLLDLKRYVDNRGYRGIGLGQLSLGDLEKRAPVLVPIKTNGYSHFVVFLGRLGNRVLLADPAWGHRTMTLDRFQAAWISYPGIAHVGFVVEHPDTRMKPAPRPPDPRRFVGFR